MFTSASNERSTFIAKSWGSSLNKALAVSSAEGGGTGFETYRFLKFIVGVFVFCSVLVTEGIFLDSFVRSESDFTYNGGGADPFFTLLG